MAKVARNGAEILWVIDDLHDASAVITADRIAGKGLHCLCDSDCRHLAMNRISNKAEPGTGLKVRLASEADLVDVEDIGEFRQWSPLAR